MLKSLCSIILTSAKNSPWNMIELTRGTNTKWRCDNYNIWSDCIDFEQSTSMTFDDVNESTSYQLYVDSIGQSRKRRRNQSWLIANHRAEAVVVSFKLVIQYLHCLKTIVYATHTNTPMSFTFASPTFHNWEWSGVLRTMTLRVLSWSLTFNADKTLSLSPEVWDNLNCWHDYRMQIFH